MWSDSSQMFLITLLMIFFNGIRSDAGSAPLLKVSNISASGITDDKELEKLQLNCCGHETGSNSGLCLSPNDNLTIDIVFHHEMKVDKLVIQTPQDFNYGYIKTFKIMYKKSKEDTDVLYYTRPDQIWTVFANDPSDSDREQIISLLADVLIVETISIQIVSFEKVPCLRMEVLGCLEKDCPAMWAPPLLDAVDAGPNENAVNFRCKVTDRDLEINGVMHKAEWILDNKKLPIEVEPKSGRIVSTLHQSKLYNYIPFINDTKTDYKGGLKCSVIACPESGCVNWMSKPKASDQLLPNFEYNLGGEENSLTLREGGSGVPIRFKLKAPPVLYLRRDYLQTYGSSVLVRALFIKRPDDQCKTSTTDRNEVKLEDTCGRHVTSSNWNTEHKLILKPVTHGLYSPAQVTRKFVFKLLHVDDIGKQVWSTHLTEKQLNVKVNTASGWKPAKSRTGSSCYANSDPHFTTFDGLYYSAHVQGEFIMYRNKKYGYQVNAIFEPCTIWGGTCTCGVAIKVGNDVVTIGHCSTGTLSSRFLKAFVWQHGKLTPGFRVYNDISKHTYHVYLPIGTYITVSVLAWTRTEYYVNFLIEPSLADRNQTEGLCGFYDGTQTHDLREKSGGFFQAPYRWYSRLDNYALHWKEDIKPCPSIFKGVAENQKEAPGKTYCTCVLGSDSWDCGEHKDSESCTPEGVIDITDKHLLLRPKDPSPNHCEIEQNLPNMPKQRTKRATGYSPPAKEDDEYRSFVFDTSFVPKDIFWPTPSGWTEEKAKKYCEDFLLSNDAVKNCKGFLGKTFEDEIQACVSDIKAADGTDFAKGTLEIIISQCFSEAEKHPATTTVLPGGMQRSVLYDSLCLDDCNNNGVCKDAHCVCNPGFYGSTCSLTKDIPPDIVCMSRNGLCNTRNTDCTKSFVYGTGHIDSSDLKCRMTPYDHRTGIRDLKGQFTSTAIYVNFNLLVCPHNNKNGTFLVAVSNNNGQDYSKDELLFLAYDSACHNCSSVDQDEKKANCTQETYGCAVGSACYLDGEVDEGNLCWICDTNRNIDNWSVNTAYSNCTTAPEDNIALIAGVSTAAVLVVAIIITVVLTLKFCGRAKSVSPPDIQEEAGRSESTADEPKPEKADNRKMSGVSINSITPSLTA